MAAPPPRKVLQSWHFTVQNLALLLSLKVLDAVLKTSSEFLFFSSLEHPPPCACEFLFFSYFFLFYFIILFFCQQLLSYLGSFSSGINLLITNLCLQGVRAQIQILAIAFFFNFSLFYDRFFRLNPGSSGSLRTHVYSVCYA